MIKDEMLRKAAEEWERESLTELPQEDHEFSEAFQRRLAQTKRQKGRSAGVAAMRCVAAVLVLCLTVFGVLMAVSPEVRADVENRYKAFYYTVTGSSEVPKAERKDFCLTWLPEGYKEWGVTETSQHKIYSYVDSEGHGLSFVYWYDGKIQMGVQNYERKTVMLGDIEAEVFLSPYADESSSIVWEDPVEGVHFSIMAHGDEELLIKLVLGVAEKKK